MTNLFWGFLAGFLTCAISVGVVLYLYRRESDRERVELEKRSKWKLPTNISDTSVQALPRLPSVRYRNHSIRQPKNLQGHAAREEAVGAGICRHGSPEGCDLCIDRSHLRFDIDEQFDQRIKGRGRRYATVSSSADVRLAPVREAMGAQRRCKHSGQPAPYPLSSSVPFVYEAVQDLKVPQLTLWRMSVYGALMDSDSRAPTERVSAIYVLTAPKGSPVADLGRLLAGLEPTKSAKDPQCMDVTPFTSVSSKETAMSCN